MKANKVVELFQSMVIMSLNMGNLSLKVKTLKNILTTWEREQAVLQEELDKERDFQKGYKYNVEIQRNNKAKAEQKNKILIKNFWMKMKSSKIA